MVGIKGGKRIGLNAAASAEKARKTRSARRFGCQRYAGLENAVALAHGAFFDYGAVGWVQHGAYHFFDCTDIQIGVGIKCDQIGCAFDKIGVARNKRKIVGFAVDKVNKIDERTAFTLVSDILVFGLEKLLLRTARKKRRL